MSDQPVQLPADLAEIERVAVELATLAGAEISVALGGMLAVRYKGGSAADDTWRDPVSEADHRIEQLIRDRIGRHFPDHGVIGEEFEDQSVQGRDTIWAIDPIDGTTNFINGFPLFAAAIGVLHRGRPVAAALWCATSHALRPGVYHARSGGTLKFDGSPVEPKVNPDIKRRLAGVPAVQLSKGPWDTRRTGSAAIECAFVAAGLLDAARFETPNLWDVAGGIMLVEASGGHVLVRKDDTWVDFSGFEAVRKAETGAQLSNWVRPVIVGRPGAEFLRSSLG